MADNLRSMIEKARQQSSQNSRKIEKKATPLPPPEEDEGFSDSQDDDEEFEDEEELEEEIIAPAPIETPKMTTLKRPSVEKERDSTNPFNKRMLMTQEDINEETIKQIAQEISMYHDNGVYRRDMVNTMRESLSYQKRIAEALETLTGVKNE